jgi:hypothetical protein
VVKIGGIARSIVGRFAECAAERSRSENRRRGSSLIPLQGHMNLIVVLFDVNLLGRNLGLS